MTTCLARLLAARGLTIVHPFPVQLFNSQGCPEEHQLPTFGRTSTLAIVIGNNNALWPVFIQHLAAHPDALSASNPLDDLIEAIVMQAVQEYCQELLPVQQQQAQQQCSQAGCAAQQQEHQQDAPSQQDRSYITQQNVHHQQQHDSSSSTQQPDPSGPRFIVRFSHHTEPGKFVNMMRAAQLSGLAYYSNTTHLCMHPVYGPWFALRAVAVIDVDGPDPAAFSQLPCPYPDVEAEAAQQMQRLEKLGGFSSWQQHWREWAALRTLGGKHTDPKYAYSGDQLEYHYTKNKEVLKRAVASLQGRQQQQQQDLDSDGSTEVEEQQHAQKLLQQARKR